MPLTPLPQAHLETLEYDHESAYMRIIVSAPDVGRSYEVILRSQDVHEFMDMVDKLPVNSPDH